MRLFLLDCSKFRGAIVEKEIGALFHLQARSDGELRRPSLPNLVMHSWYLHGNIR